MFTRVFTAIKGNPEIVGEVGVTSSIVGFIYSEHKNTQRHREIIQLGQESNKGQERLAKSQEMVAKEMCKANSLNELRLKDSLKEVKAPSVLADDQIKFCSLSKFFFLFVNNILFVFLRGVLPFFWKKESCFL